MCGWTMMRRDCGIIVKARGNGVADMSIQDAWVYEMGL